MLTASKVICLKDITPTSVLILQLASFPKVLWGQQDDMLFTVNAFYACKFDSTRTK